MDNWLARQNQQQRCSRCRYIQNHGYSTCACSCKHEYKEEITKVLAQLKDNTFIGDVCKNCGDIKNERLYGTKKEEIIGFDGGLAPF